MARIEGIDDDRIDNGIARVFDEQTAKWGARLEPYEIFARRPSLFHAVLGMWEGLGASGLIDVQLKTLVNRRVAAHNGCVF